MDYLFENASAEVMESYCVSPAENTSAKTTEGIVHLMKQLLKEGGPSLEDYPLLDEIFNQLYFATKSGSVTEAEVAQMKGLFGEEFLAETIHGYGYRKPMGYAGDFMMIDKIYTYHKTEHPVYRNWDKYFHSNIATKAVRNRKAYFKNQLTEKLEGVRETVNLLNVASGPARDLFELYQLIDPEQLKATCVDIDARAIDYAKGVCLPFLKQIQFFNKNILTFSTEEKYDVIWSAGLFDYFEDKVFVLALRKFISWLKPGGEIIIGNFSEDNASRGYMEVFGEWILIHRSQDELMRLAMEAGASKTQISVEKEPLGVNLFLKIKG